MQRLFCDRFLADILCRIRFFVDVLEGVSRLCPRGCRQSEEARRLSYAPRDEVPGSSPSRPIKPLILARRENKVLDLPGNDKTLACPSAIPRYSLSGAVYLYHLSYRWRSNHVIPATPHFVPIACQSSPVRLPYEKRHIGLSRLSPRCLANALVRLLVYSWTSLWNLVDHSTKYALFRPYRVPK